jgi:steroid 5-alpha reductase family enzyme
LCCRRFFSTRHLSLPPSNKRQEIDRKSARLTLLNKAVMWASVSALYVALFVPAWAVAAAPDAPTPGSLADRISRAGVAAAWAGLWLEVTADICKAVDKWRNPRGFSSGCVYRVCRQPNLLGEAIFWLGTALAGAPALAAKPALAVLAAGGTAAILSILVGDSARKTEDQGKRMAAAAGWSEYAAKTPPLWPLPRRGPV